MPLHQATPIPTTPPTEPSPAAVQPAAAVLPLPSDKSHMQTPPEPDEPPPKRPAVKRGAAIEPFAPSDPFDAEIFNRRYFRAPAEQSP